MPSPADKRLHPRVPFVLKVDYRDRAELADATENLSRGGLFVQTDLPMEIGASVPLSLSFPGLLDPVEIVGKVAWVRPSLAGRASGVGISVESDSDKQRLDRLLSPPPADAPAIARIPSEGFKVLIVEDNPHIVEMYSYVLKKLATTDLKGKVPLEVHFAADGHAALTELQQGRFSLVMTDLYMPVMDGFQLVEKIRAEPTLKEIPVVAISAGGKDAQERATKLGVNMYLRKPVRFAEVLETVKRLLNIG
jgi:uncharacterized protein (TIGR02266 family)